MFFQWLPEVQGCPSFSPWWVMENGVYPSARQYIIYHSLYPTNLLCWLSMKEERFYLRDQPNKNIDYINIKSCMLEQTFPMEIKWESITGNRKYFLRNNNMFWRALLSNRWNTIHDGWLDKERYIDISKNISNEGSFEWLA